MSTTEWILFVVGAFCFGWTLGADWLEDGGPFFGRWRGKPRGRAIPDPEEFIGPRKKKRRVPTDLIGRPKANPYCQLVGCEIRSPHSHAEDLMKRLRQR